MKITQVRNATLLVEFGGAKFLVDPYLGEKESYEGLPGTSNSHLRNPRTELKTPIDELLAVDAVLVTHTHPDHWDEAAVACIPKHLPIFVQNDQDAKLIQSQGFKDVRVLLRETLFEGVAIVKTSGQHGSNVAIAAMGEILGEVSGLVLKHTTEKTLYVAGDTVWNEDVRSALEVHSPEVVVLNAGDAQVPGLGSIIMGLDDLLKVHDAAPQAVLIASHMEAVSWPPK